MHLKPIATAWVVSALTLVACGKTEAPQEPEADAAPAVAAAPASPAPASPGPTAPTSSEERVISVEDIDRWQRGIAAELKAVQEAAARLAAATQESDKLAALHASLPMTTVDAGAAAAGLDRDAYRDLHDELSSAASTLSPIETEMNVSGMPEPMVAQMKQGREESAAQLAKKLPADVFEALKTRAAELRTQEKELVAARLKLAQAAR